MILRALVTLVFALLFLSAGLGMTYALHTGDTLAFVIYTVIGLVAVRELWRIL